MNRTVVKRIEDFSDESDEFEIRLDEEQGDTGREQLLDEIVAWLDECADHGRYFQPASVGRRALRHLISLWEVRLREHGRGPTDGIQLAEHDPEAGIALTVDCPYPGLDPYGEDNGAIFFGRQPLIDAHVAHLEDETRRILLVIGASGSGKSSLALAGVLPALKQRHADDWLFPAPFTPGASPLRALASSLAGALADGVTASAIEQALADDPAPALATVAGLCGGRSPMFLVDQFEELFTVCRSADERERFVEILLALSEPAASGDTCKPRVLLTVRADYSARIESYPRLHARLNVEKNLDHIGALDASDIRRAIAEPARQVGLRFPDALIDQLAVETASLPNGLPLLQFALRWLWQERPRDESGNPKDLITADMVKRLPSVKGALGTVANGVYAGFNENQQQVCHRLMLELIVLDETFEEPLRRRRREAELVGVLQRRFPVAPADPAHVINAFVEAGLVRRFGAGEDSQLEVAHEALLRHWRQFSDILDMQDIKTRLHDVKLIGREAADWMARGRSESELKLKGEGLERACRLAEDGWLEEAEPSEYVSACSDLEARARQEKERAAEETRKAGIAQEAARESELRQARAEARAERLAKQGFRWLVVGVPMVVFFLVFVYFKFGEREQTNAANLTAYSSVASTLPPWDDLDVAYTLAKEFGAPFRFALARALERMEDTTLIGDDRTLALVPNDDGGALLQFHGASPSEHTLRIFVLAGAARASSPARFIIDLEGRKERLATFKVGPAIGPSGDRLALLVFRTTGPRPGLSVETYRLSVAAAGQTIAPLHTHLIDDAVEVLGLSFHKDGNRATFVAVLQSGASGASPGRRVVDITVDAHGRTLAREELATETTYPVEAVAFVGDQIVEAYANGSVRCPGTGYVDTRAEHPSKRSPIRQLASLQLPVRQGEVLIALSIDGIYDVDCARGQRHVISPADGASSITLVSSSRHGEPQPLLSFRGAQGRQCFGRNSDNRWTEQPCNNRHRVAYAVPMPVSANNPVAMQLTIEDPKIAAIHVHPMEALETEHRMFSGRSSGGMTVRWRPPGGGADDKPAARDETRSSWASTETGFITTDNSSGTILDAVLSRDGSRLLWLEWNPDARGATGSRYRLRWARIDALDEVDELDRNFTPDALAIGSDGTVAVAWPVTRSSGAAPEPEPATLVVEGDALYKFKQGDEPVSCLGFSPDAAYLVAGTRTGRVAVWRRSSTTSGRRWATTDPDPWRAAFHEPLEGELRWWDVFGSSEAAAPAPSLQEVTSCDIADDGELVVGGAEGSVARRRVPDELPQQLTQRIAFRLATRVKDVSIEDSGGRRYVLALGDWQTSNCSRPALPGHALSVWDTTTLADDDSLSPVASVCFPNEPVLSLGGMLAHAPSKPPGIRLVSAMHTEQSREHECVGCAIGNESAKEMLERLLKMAKEQEKAVLLGSTRLYRLYGLQF